VTDAGPLRRVAIVGTTGSGKSTLAQRLAALLGGPAVDLDDLNWLPGWREVPHDVMRAKVRAAVAGERWVIAGNYRRVQDLILARADAVVVLDYPLPIVFGRLWRRTFRRWWRRELCCNGNRERLAEHFLRRDSLFLWCLTTYRRRRRQYHALAAAPPRPELQVIVFTTPWQAERWLARIAASL
jgi:adenylate kinase family enzyme